MELLLILGVFALIALAFGFGMMTGLRRADEEVEKRMRIRERTEKKRRDSCE